jgi:sugar phosphate permease
MTKIFPYRYRIFIFIFFLFLITFLDRSAISLVGVRIKTAFKLTNDQFGWVLAVFVLAYGLFEIPAGILTDRIGQRAALIRIVLWWSLFTALTGVTTGFYSLICARFLFGMGEAGAYPANSGIVGRWYPVNERGKAMSAMVLGAGVGLTLAPLIVVPLASTFGWRMPFFVIAVVGILWALVCISWFRNSPSEMPGISGEERNYIEKDRRLSTKRSQIAWKAVFKHRSLWALVLMFYCCQWATYFFTSWMPVYLQEGRHFSENEMKYITSFSSVSGIFAGILAGIFSDWLVKRKGLKFGRRFVGMIALGILGILFLFISLTTNNTIVVVCITVARFFLPVTAIVSYAVCIDIGRENVGTVAGVMNFFGQMGAFFLAIIFGKIVGATHNFNAPLFVIALVLLTGALFWLAIDPTKLITENEDTRLGLIG